MIEIRRTTAKVTISRQSGNVDIEKPICITIGDGATHNRLIEVRMSLADFASALTGTAFQDADAIVYPNGISHIGATREQKTELIPWPKAGASKAHIRALVAVHEVDGWVGDDTTATNWHNHVGDKARVNYTRYMRDGVPVT